VGGALLQAGGEAVARASTDLQELRAIATTLFRANEANPDPNTSVVVGTAALLALVARRRLGVGQQVYVDMLGANAWANGDDFIRYAGKPERPAPGPDLLGLCATYRLYAAREGWVFLALLQESEFAAFCAAANAEHVAADPRFGTAAARASNDAALAEALSAVLSTRSADDWERALAPNGIGCVRADGPVPGEFWLDDAHVRENGFVVPVKHPRYGDSVRWGTLTRFSRTPEQPGPGCLSGDHTDVILAELGYSEDAVQRLRGAGVVWSEAIAPFPGA
jgi:crotonobetainyl-CoA:carnitine CoA-transferase CaiB-like acyl-CoA transferase